MPTEPIRKLQPGRSAPLGATSDGRGVNFAIWSGAATKVELCVFEGGVETRHELPANSNDVWHGFLPGAEAGLTYGYRVHGDYDPKNGNRFNPHKLLIDPYAKLLQGDVIHDSRLQDGLATKDGWTMDTRDSAPVMPKCVVIETQSDPRETKRPRTALADSVIYELHVKGYTRLHPDVPPALRGTYLGLAEPVIIEHLRRLKITAIELLPCASFMSEPELVKRGLSNYWGYNPAAFFAPHAAYAINDPIGEFQTMVRVMHEAGIEVLVDVVYNHTAEGNAHGPTLNFRGIDNAAYYQLRHHNRAEYVNNSGCGNSVAVNGPPVLKLVLDSLRYWTEVLGV
ncbi:MAG: alpha-amylase family glycosyl hydrolase, partial [Gammaproteobacteria bacterium]|nr:alpha-amylase family glycosyl hydrolase [Gammaproteobacteria bacterium]